MSDNKVPFGARLFVVVTVVCGAALLYGAFRAAWHGLQQVIR